MGYIKHSAIIVTGNDYGDKVAVAHAEAERIFATAQPEPLPGIVSPIIKSAMNGYLSFLVAPDGSKEGWSHSESGRLGAENVHRVVARS